MIFDFTKYDKLGVWVKDLSEAEQVRDALLKEYPTMQPHGGNTFMLSQEAFECQVERAPEVDKRVMFFMYAPDYQGDYGIVSGEHAHMVPFSFKSTKNTLSKAMKFVRKNNANNQS